MDVGLKKCCFKRRNVFLLIMWMWGRLDVLLVSCLFLAGEEASLVCTADPRCYTQEHYGHHQHSQYNPNNINIICGVPARKQKCGHTVENRLHISLTSKRLAVVNMLDEYLYLWHTHRLPSAGPHTPSILLRSSLGRSTRLHLLFGLRWTSASGKITKKASYQ